MGNRLKVGERSKIRRREGEVVEPNKIIFVDIGCKGLTVKTLKRCEARKVNAVTFNQCRKG